MGDELLTVTEAARMKMSEAQVRRLTKARLIEHTRPGYGGKWILIYAREVERHVRACTVPPIAEDPAPARPMSTTGAGGRRSKHSATDVPVVNEGSGPASKEAIEAGWRIRRLREEQGMIPSRLVKPIGLKRVRQLHLLEVGIGLDGPGAPQIIVKIAGVLGVEPGDIFPDPWPGGERLRSMPPACSGPVGEVRSPGEPSPVRPQVP